MRAYIEGWVGLREDTAAKSDPEFSSQCTALLEAAPPIISSIMGVFEPEFVKEMKSRNIRWFANVSTVKEAIEAEAAGADVVVAKGIEAGGHSAAFDPQNAGRCEAGLMALVPAIADAVHRPAAGSGQRPRCGGTVACL